MKNNKRSIQIGFFSWIAFFLIVAISSFGLYGCFVLPHHIFLVLFSLIFFFGIGFAAFAFAAECKNERKVAIAIYSVTAALVTPAALLIFLLLVHRGYSV